MRGGIGVLDCRTDFADIAVVVGEMMRDAHGIQNRLDDAHAVTRRIARGRGGVVAEQPDHHADRLLVLDRYAADRVYGVEKACVLDEREGSLVAVMKAGGDSDAFVLLAHPYEPKLRVARDRAQQAFAGHDVGHGENELHAAGLDCRNDGGALQPYFFIGLHQHIRRHRLSPGYLSEKDYTVIPVGASVRRAESRDAWSAAARTRRMGARLRGDDT